MTIDRETLLLTFRDGPEHLYRDTFPVTFEDKHYEVVTDGRGLLAVRRDVAVEPSSPHLPKPENAARLFREAAEREPLGSFLFAELRAFLEPYGPLYEFQKARRCQECRGCGTRECDLGGVHECFECDGEGSLPDGWVDTRKEGGAHADELANFGGVLLNGKLVGALLREVTSTTVRIHRGGQFDSVMFRGDDDAWIAIVMPLKLLIVDAPADVRSFPPEPSVEVARG